MDELEFLRGFQGDVSEPDEATIGRARTALMERMDIEKSRFLRPGARPLAQMTLPRRWAAPLTVAAVLTVAVALVVTILLPRGGRQAAAAELRRFAAVAVERPAAARLGPGQYYYLRNEGWIQITDATTSDEAYSVRIPIVREYWIGDDGSGRLVATQAGELLWPGPLDKSRWEAQGSPQLYGPSDQQYGPGELVGPGLDGGALGTLPVGYDFASLPRDPEALYEAISSAAAERQPRAPEEAPQPSSLGTFGLFIELLYTPLTPPDIRSALFEAMAYIPGVTVVLDKTIPGMGTGTAVFVETVMGGARIRLEFLVDPTTSQPLGQQETLLDRVWWVDADPPSVSHSIVYASPDVVESTARRP